MEGGWIGERKVPGGNEQLAVFHETAVSALTSIVNLQGDGFAYVP